MRTTLDIGTQADVSQAVGDKKRSDQSESDSLRESSTCQGVHKQQASPRLNLQW